MATSRKSTTPAQQESVLTLPTGDFADMRDRALAITTPEAAADYAKDMLGAFRVAGTVEREAGARKSVVASLAAYTMFASGALIEGERKRGKDGKATDGYAEDVLGLTEFGTFWSTHEDGTGASSPASVRTWIRSGEAFIRFGLDADAPEAYALLGGVAQSSAWNEARATIKKELDAPDAPTLSPEDFTAKVAEVAQSEKDRKAAAKAKREAERNAPSDPAGPTVPDTLAKKVEMVEAIVGGLRVTDDAERDALMRLAKLVEDALGQGDADAA